MRGKMGVRATAWILRGAILEALVARGGKETRMPSLVQKMIKTTLTEP